MIFFIIGFEIFINSVNFVDVDFFSPFFFLKKKASWFILCVCLKNIIWFVTNAPA